MTACARCRSKAKQSIITGTWITAGNMKPCFSELSEKELNQLFVMDEYGVENSHFTVHGYDIEVKDTLIAEALQALSDGSGM